MSKKRTKKKNCTIFVQSGIILSLFVAFCLLNHKVKHFQDSVLFLGR